MGGFMINGCGAADSYYLLKSLPGHTCRLCRKNDYALMELKRKIRVLYIPTVSLSTKYAVVCPKCKEGYYVSDAQKDFILRNDPSCVEIVSDGVVIHGFGSSQPERIIDTEVVTEVEEQPVPETKGAYCSNCGAVLSPNTIFCTQCGTRRNTSTPTPVVIEETIPATTEESIPAVAEEASLAEKPVEMPATPSVSETKTADNVCISVNNSHETSTNASNLSSASDKFVYNYQRGKVCPDCGMRAAPGKERCSICGAKL